MKKTILVMLATLSMCFFVSSAGNTAEKATEAEKSGRGLMSGLMSAAGTAKFDDEGALIRPVNYREWIFVGAPVTPNDLNGGKADFPEFHNVYIDRKSFALYKRTGKFRDGTVLVKELVNVGAKKAASGNGYFEGNYMGLAAAVKDSQRFPKEPGHWAYFNFTGEGGKLKEKAEAAPTASCNACHQANAAEDWVFTQYYPVLRAAKPK